MNLKSCLVKADFFLCKAVYALASISGFESCLSYLLKDLGLAFIAAPLLRIRINKQHQILPEYLNWFINQNNAQQFFTKRSKGTAHKMISKKTVEDLEVIVPDIQMQRNIIELAKLSYLETVLMNQILQKRHQYISKVLMDMTKEK
ncbi:restriction endonuclease subunit S [Candidatus Magnetomorum sp. HK-1]|nr:restriction endonuclease subunit S [Candidatus Magnetomorum sp. HK-1]